jgi:hypothetical protein
VADCIKASSVGSIDEKSFRCRERFASFKRSADPARPATSRRSASAAS